MIRRKSLKYLLITMLLLLALIASSCTRSSNETNPSTTPSPSHTQETEPTTAEPAPATTAAPTSETLPGTTSTTKTEPSPTSTAIPEPKLPPSFEDTAIISEDGSTITVHNAVELIYHMASNRHFLLAPNGDYDLDALDRTINPACFDGRLINLENVVIEGSGVEQVDFFTRTMWKGVLAIENCSGITLKNLNLGHDPLPGINTCLAGVVYLQNAATIVIDDCTLFGCGSVGLHAQATDNLNCKNSIIRDCSLNLIELHFMKNATFENCEFINSEDQAIVINEHENILFRDCKLVGTIFKNVNVYIDGENIYDLANFTDTARIEEMKVSDVQFVSIDIVGNPLDAQIVKLHEGLEASVKGEIDYFGQMTVFCNLLYSSPIEENEFLKQINRVRNVIAKSLPLSRVVVYVEWPGMEMNMMMDYSGHIRLRDNYSDLAKVMDDGRNYLSPAEAEAAFRQWLPPTLAADGGERINEEYTLELYDTVIDGENAYYSVGISPYNSGFREHYYINAYDGSLFTFFEGQEFAPIKHASQAEIAAVLEYIRENEGGLPEDSYFRAFIVQEKYVALRSDKVVRHFLLSEENDKITAFPFYEWQGGG